VASRAALGLSTSAPLPLWCCSGRLAMLATCRGRLATLLLPFLPLSRAAVTALPSLRLCCAAMLSIAHAWAWLATTAPSPRRHVHLRLVSLSWSLPSHLWHCARAAPLVTLAVASCMCCPLAASYVPPRLGQAKPGPIPFPLPPLLPGPVEPRHHSGMERSLLFNSTCTRLRHLIC
jgi:hypothetical protein